MPAPTNNWAHVAPLPAFDPVKRAKAIREAIAKKRIKHTKELEEILMLLDQIGA